ncbi:MAG TPA: hypothetical protein RMH99_24035 [Sandaracinaceae bacterium LLY-WYZ-13_1]|nr:hypothetical protein [Sandaracinaceae bacterium LLY-WYZ-13_1]
MPVSASTARPVCYEPATVPERPALRLAGDERGRAGDARVDGAVRARRVRSAAEAPTGPFGSSLAPRLEAARDLRDGRVEVYERVWDAARGQRRRVSTLTREASGVSGGRGGWRLESEARCDDEEAVAWIVSPSERLRAALEPGRLPDGSRVEPAGDGARLADETGRWFAAMRAASVEVPRAWMHAVGPAPVALRVRVSLSREPGARHEQLTWLSRVLPDVGRGSHRIVGVPGADRWVPADEWRELAGRVTRRRWRALLGLWTRVARLDGRWATRGLSRFMLPELQVDATLPAATSVLRTWMIRLIRHHDRRTVLGLGAEAPALWERSFRLFDHGRGAPRAVRLEALDTCLRLGPVADEPWRVTLARPIDARLRTRWGTVRLRGQ